MTIEEIRDRGTYWRQRLQLREWANINYVVRSVSEMAELGRSSWMTEECTATIEIREDAKEDTIVHEMLHLVIDGHKRYRRYNELTERAINRIAAALTD